MGLKLAPKIVRHSTHRDDPTVGAKTDRLNLLCIQLVYDEYWDKFQNHTRQIEQR